jgi:hypothetical protein
MNYRDWRTIWPNGWMFIQDEQSAGRALTRELAVISWQTRSG